MSWAGHLTLTGWGNPVVDEHLIHGRNRITPSCFMFWKAEISTGLMGLQASFDKTSILLQRTLNRIRYGGILQKFIISLLCYHGYLQMYV